MTGTYKIYSLILGKDVAICEHCARFGTERCPGEDYCYGHFYEALPRYIVKNQWGSMKKWKYSRETAYAIVYHRDCRCRDCGVAVHDPMLPPSVKTLPCTEFNVHHILHREFGGTDHPSNLVLLCRECHKQYHARAHVQKPFDGVSEEYQKYWEKLGIM